MLGALDEWVVSHVDARAVCHLEVCHLDERAVCHVDERAVDERGVCHGVNGKAESVCVTCDV